VAVAAAAFTKSSAAMAIGRATFSRWITAEQQLDHPAVTAAFCSTVLSALVPSSAAAVI
jgi:hypothetical protein